MDARDILRELDRYGSPQIKKIFMNHGAREPLSGVRIADLKKIQKRVKVDHDLALELFETGHYDAMYLAGLIADDAKMTKKDLDRWVARSYAGISEYTVPWVAAQGRFGYEMGLKWIASKKAHVAAAGWMTLCGVVALTPDDALDVDELASLLTRIRKEIHNAPNRVRSAMNTFIIAAGGYVLPLTKKALETARAVGEVTDDVGDTECKVPLASEYIAKMQKRGSLGKKRKMVKC